MDKDTIRDWVRRRRRALSSAWIVEASDLIQTTVLGFPEFMRARTVCAYAACQTEVRTGRIIDACWDAGKKVCVPVSCVETGGYGLAPVTREARWRVGPHGIREPVDALRMDPGEVDAVVVPGVAFDAYGRRLGHGGGHYDRLLLDMARSRGRSPFRGGLAFDFQMFDRVPVDEWDVPVDAVVTETKEMRALGSAEGKAVEG